MRSMCVLREEKWKGKHKSMQENVAGDGFEP